MKSLLALLIFTMLAVSCSNEGLNPPSEIVGEWHLEGAQLDLESDSSETVVFVNRAMTFNFSANGTYTSNRADCLNESSSGLQSAGIYDAEGMVITPNECESKVYYEFKEIFGSRMLVLNFQRKKLLRFVFKRIE
jgi:hypothetical protein